MNTFTLTLPASWASALVNDDFSGLEYYSPEEAEVAREVLQEHGSPLDCGDAYMGRFDGLMCEVADYIFPGGGNKSCVQR